MLVMAGYYQPGMTTRRLLKQFDVKVLVDLLYVEYVRSVSEQAGCSYSEAKDHVDKTFDEMRPKSKQELAIERANRLKHNVTALGRMLRGG